MDLTPSKKVGTRAFSARLPVKPCCVWSMQVSSLRNWKRMVLHPPCSWLGKSPSNLLLLMRLWKRVARVWMDQHFQSGLQRIAGVWITALLHPTHISRRRRRSFIAWCMPQRRSYSPPCSTARSPRLTSSWAKWMMKTRVCCELLLAWLLGAVSDDADESDLEKSHIEWDSTDKHRVLFVIKKTTLQKLVGPESAEARRNMWRHGHLHFVLSAPRASCARWRMKVAPKLVQPAPFRESFKAYLPGKDAWVCQTIQHQAEPRMLRLITNQTSHIMMLVEGTSLTVNQWDKKLRAANWTLSSSDDGHHWVGVRKAEHDAKILGVA